MSLIHSSFAWNWSRPSSRLKLARIPMPTAAVTRVVSSATTLIRPSSAFGISSTIAMPTSGRNTASVRAQLSNQSIEVIPLDSDVCDQEQQSEKPHHCEHVERVPLHSSRLEVPQETTALAGDLGRPVDRAVDDLAVEVVVGPLAGHLGALACAVHHRVDHVLVEPVTT